MRPLHPPWTSGGKGRPPLRSFPAQHHHMSAPVKGPPLPPGPAAAAHGLLDKSRLNCSSPRLPGNQHKRDVGELLTNSQEAANNRLLSVKKFVSEGKASQTHPTPRLHPLRPCNWRCGGGGGGKQGAGKAPCEARQHPSRSITNCARAVGKQPSIPPRALWQQAT